MNEQTIGANIRQVRLAKKASLTEVAKRAGITKGTLSKIEHGQTSSPISTLLSIATALGAHLSDFVREETTEKRCIVTRKGKGRLMVRDGSRFGYSYEGLAVDFPARLVEPFLLTIQPSDRVGKFQHEGQEFIYLLSGRVEITVGSESVEVEEGDFIYFDSTQFHQTRLLGEEPARFLCCFIEKH
jgi:transcriptional regulator with XRE-family HTH domain